MSNLNISSESLEDMGYYVEVENKESKPMSSEIFEDEIKGIKEELKKDGRVFKVKLIAEHCPWGG